MKRFVARSVVIGFLAVFAFTGAAVENAFALPPGNTAQQWNKIAEDTVVGTPGMFQVEGFQYMGYVQAAVYDAMVAIERGYQPLVPPKIKASQRASLDAAIAEASYQTLLYYFPAQAATLGSAHTDALALIPDGAAKTEGIAVGNQASAKIVAWRSGDGRLPVGTIVPYTPPASAGLAFWEPTPPALLPAQTPWVADMQPFILKSADQFLPPPPPALDSQDWVDQYNEVMLWGRSSPSPRSPLQTDIARFWTTNTVRQYSTLFRDVATSHLLNLQETVRLLAEGEIVAADAGIALMNGKYHYGFWRPITAIAQPGRDDGNPQTVQDFSWTPTVTTPNHPEYPGAHGTVTSAVAEVLSRYLHTDAINVRITSSTVATMPYRDYATAGDLRAEIVEARLWGGIHYRGSTLAGVELGREVAQWDLRHAFHGQGN
jgi:hypothetical protein